MINHASNQTSDKRPRVLAISTTFIPVDYDNSTQGFNKWAIQLKSEVHGEPVLSAKQIAYYKLFLNVRKG